MRLTYLLATGVILALGLLIPITVGARAPGASIFLRRASFDPLQALPAAVAAADMAGGSSLRLAQLDGPPSTARIAELKAVGLDPLVYIPDNTFLVRATTNRAPQISGLRWIGVLPTDYKLAPDLADLARSGADTSPLDLHVLATPDADSQALAAAIHAAGGATLGRADRLNGASLTVRLPGLALAGLAARDDVLWIERRVLPQLLNDTSRVLIGVNTARQELSWLTGTGQIVAVTDTGLDRSDSLSADFGGRIAATFTPQQMDGTCITTDWSDQDGHGTHVSGSILGSGVLSPAGISFAGVAPGAQLVVEAVINSSSSQSLDCLPTDSSYLQKAYDAGARVQNASWGAPTGGLSNLYGGYDDLAASVDDFLYRHPTHLLVVAAGNNGTDINQDGVIDADSITSPATAKNVLAVGASENNRPPTKGNCVASSPVNRCWGNYAFLSRSGQPIISDFVSDNPSGMAAFSSRGPTDDGRIKPDLVAPGSNIISTQSHAIGASYSDTYDANYAYESGTSMATPLVSGVAALVRQWLSQDRSMSDPSAALVRALLLNGARNLTPGQYGTGSAQEIPSAWPNHVEGWGRVNLGESIQLSGAQIWLHDETVGLASGGSVDYALTVTGGNPRLRATLTWTDYPGSPLTSKTLVNDLDLEVIEPDGSVILGNHTAALTSACRAEGADRCNPSESVEIATTALGVYTVRVKAPRIVTSFQPFAVVARFDGGSMAPPPPPVYDHFMCLPLVMR
ncbi:MAG: S8 family serine peptidase [Chloroflexales bacterium]